MKTQYLLKRFFVLLIILSAACSSNSSTSTPQSGNGFPLPDELALIKSDITATLFTSLEPDEKIPLTFDAASNSFKGNLSVLTGSNFDLTIIYKTIEPTSGQEVEIARYVRKNITADSENVNVEYVGDEENWEAIFDFGPGTVNSLNLDGDAYNNFVELAYGSNLLSADSVPVGPDVSATHKDPLFGNLDISLPPPGADDVAALSGEVILTFKVDTPFEINTFEISSPDYGLTILDSNSTIKTTKTLNVKINTSYFVFNKKDKMTVSVRVTDKFSISSLTDFTFAVNNASDNKPPTRLRLDLIENQIIAAATPIIWELADGSGIDNKTASILISSDSQGASLPLYFEDTDTSPNHLLTSLNIDPQDFQDGTDYKLILSAADVEGHLYTETIPFQIQRNNPTTPGANPGVKYNNVYVSRLSRVPEADAFGKANSITLDGSQSIGLNTSPLNYAWGCTASGGFSFASTSAIASLTLPNITREQDGYVILCTLTVTQGSYQNSKQIPITLSFVNQAPVVSTVTLTQKTVTSPALFTPDNWQINWQATDPDGAADVIDYDVLFSRKNSAGENISVMSCAGITENTLAAETIQNTPCVATALDSGEMANPLLLGSFRDYTVSVTAYDKSDATHSKAAALSIADTNLVGRWRFNGDLKDSSGNNNDGIFNNDSDANLANNFIDSGNSLMNSSLQFDKSKSQYVNIGNKPAFNFGTEDFTLSAWIKPTAAASGQVQIIMDKGTATIGHAFYITPNGLLAFYSNTCKELTSFDTVNTNIWQYVVVSRKSGTLKFYINGELSAVNTCLDNLTNNGGVTIGCNNIENGCISPFNGQMDEVAAYNRSLSVDEVRRLCRAQDPTGTTCPDAHKPIILQPAPNAVLQPSRTFWSWRGERDVVGEELFGDVFDILYTEYTPATPATPDKNDIIPDNLNTSTDKVHYYYVSNYKKTYQQQFSLLINNLSSIVEFDFFDSNALWFFENNLIDEFNPTNTFDINFGGVGFTDNEFGGKGLNYYAPSKQYIAASNTALFNQGTGNFSIGIYAKIHSIGTTHPLVSKLAAQAGFEFLIDQGGFLDLYIPGCTVLGALNKSAVTTTGYHYYGATRKNGQIAIYIDGKMVDQGTCTANLNNAAKLVIGCNVADATCTEFFHGVIDELYTSNEVFTAEAQLNEYCALQAMSVAAADDMPDVCLE